MVLKLKKTVNEDDMKYITFYLNLKAEINYPCTDVNNIVELTYST